MTGIDLLLYLGGLALLDTLSPTIIGVSLFLLLTNTTKKTSKFFAYLCTVVLLYFSLGILMMAGLHYITESFSTLFQNKMVSWIVFLIGAVLFTASFFIPTNKKSNIPKPKTQSIFSIIVIGVTTFFIEAGMALPYFAAIGLLISNDIPFYQSVPIIATYNMIMILPALLLFVGYKLFGRWINPSLVNLRNRLANSSNSALSWIICIVGLILIFYTLDYL